MSRIYPRNEAQDEFAEFVKNTVSNFESIANSLEALSDRVSDLAKRVAELEKR